MTIDMSQFYQVFFEETAEHLAAMESLLLGLDLASPDSEELNAIFRAAHSIKGSSGTFGFNDLAEVTHVLENLLDRIRKNELVLRNDMVDAFLDAGDILKAMLAAHQGGAPVADGTVAQICANLKALTTDAATATPPVANALPSSPLPAQPGTSFDIEFLPTVEATADHLVLPNLLQSLSAMGQLDVVVQPEAGEPGLWRLRLFTGRPQAEFEDFLEFVSEKDAWRVRRAATDTVDASGAYGLFDAVVADAVDDAYGLFEPEETAAASCAIVADEGDGFGFFEPLPTAPDGVLAASDGETGLEGDGFGFFAPLPESAAGLPEVLAPAPVADAVKVAVVAPATVLRESRTKQATAPGGEAASIRVSVERADQLINLVGELVITQAMLFQCAAQMHDAAPEALTNGLAQLERNTRGLQEAIMSIRMMPISFVFSRFPRVVRDLSTKLGKQVELKMNGETTELDKGLIERIADPLTHLIRNSLDHGVELPEKRVSAGKSPVGTITLKAAHQGGNIVIEVGDDGAGLDRQRILSKARERGFQVSDQMTDQDVWALIFEAGFSTAEVVTDVSGRGVGMDVVRRNIQAMGGRIEIESMIGVGTRMTVRLPLTLAILDGMSVAVGEHIYILPLSYVIESLQPERGDVKTLSNQTRVIQVRNEYLPVVSLHDMFRVPGAETDFTRGIMIVLDADGTKAALFVDALVGQHQVVIKSLEQNYRRVSGISGATIMGDGRVALILDVSALIELSRAAQAAAVPLSA